MTYSKYKQQRILRFYFEKKAPPTIKQLLAKEGLKASRYGIFKFLQKYKQTGTIQRRAGSGRPSKITAEIKALVEQQMRRDDETTAHQLHRMINNAGYSVSIRTVLRCRVSLGWTFRGSSYCQLIRDANKAKRLDWAKKHKGETFEEVIFTDESSIQMEAHRRFACRKIGERPKNKPRHVFTYCM